MTVTGVMPGDVLTYWHDDGIGGTIGYARVIRVNRVTVTVETEHHGRHRLAPGFFNRKVHPGEWSPWNMEGN